ncbi:MAG: IS66 family insertion sequence element accessory protein TnpB [Balneolaceae bacterium]
MTKKEKRMFSLVEAWRESGKSRKEFCSQRQMKVSTFAYWITRKNKTDHTGQGFLPVDVSVDGERKGSVEIHYPNGFACRRPPGM